MHTQSPQARPAEIRKKLAVACALALTAGASLASSPPMPDAVGGSADAQPFTIDGSHKVQEFTVVVDANAAAVPKDVQSSYFEVNLALTVAENASGPAEIVVLGDTGSDQFEQPIRLGIARGEMRQTSITARGAFDSCRSDRTCTRGLTVMVRHVGGGAVTVAPSTHASIIWPEDEQAPRSGEMVVTYLDLDPAADPQTDDWDR